MGHDKAVRLAGVAVVAVCAILAVARAIPFDVAVVIALVSIGVVAGAEVVLHRRHSDQAEDFASRHGWEHLPSSYAYSTRLTGYPFDLPGAVHQSDVLRGRFQGMRCATYTYVVVQEARVGDQRGEVRHTFQVTLAELPVALPRLDIVPENLAHRAAQALGGMDVEVESHAFNARWRVRARDRRYAHDVIDPRMIARLLEPDAEGLAIRIDGAAVAVWQQGRHGTETLAGRLGVVTGIARRIPDHVMRRYRELGHEVRDPDAPLVGPDWAITPGALTSRRYTGIGGAESSRSSMGHGGEQPPSLESA